MDVAGAERGKKPGKFMLPNSLPAQQVCGKRIFEVDKHKVPLPYGLLFVEVTFTQVNKLSQHGLQKLLNVLRTKACVSFDQRRQGKLEA
jgi:hypothetical protein